jgi:hypothetical protein
MLVNWYSAGFLLYRDVIPRTPPVQILRFLVQG